MMEENIIRFLQTGELQNLQYGISIEDVIRLVGKSTCFAPISKRDPRVAIYKYGMVELYFSNGSHQSLIGVQITYSQEGEQNKLALKLFDFADPLGFHQVQQVLAKYDIPYTVEEREPNNEKVICTEKNIKFYFYDGKLTEFGKFLDA